MSSEQSETAAATESNDEAASSAKRSIRLGAFYLAVLATLAVAGVMMGSELLTAFTGWFTDMGIHQVHDVTLFSMLWIALLVPMALLLYRPASRVNTVLAPLAFLVPFAAFTYLAASPILMLPLIFGALSLVVLVLHPAGRSLLGFDRVSQPNRALAAFLVVAAIPLLVYAGDQVVRQLTAGDEHALFAHYGGMAIASTYVVAMGALAVLRERDWRFAAWSAGVVAALIGAASVLYTVESSAGPLWGTLAVLWGVAFVAATEYVRRNAVDLHESSAEADAETVKPT